MAENSKTRSYRKKTRELLVRIVFQMTSTGDFSDAAKQAFLNDMSLYLGDVAEDTPVGCLFDAQSGEQPDMPYLEWAFECVRSHLAEIDKALSGASEKWAVSRMSTVDLAVLRVAAAELLYVDGIDDSVSINEAVVIAKKYGSEKSAAFVNGILGAIVRSKKENSGAFSDAASLAAADVSAEGGGEDRVKP